MDHYMRASAGRGIALDGGEEQCCAKHCDHDAAGDAQEEGRPIEPRLFSAYESQGCSLRKNSQNRDCRNRQRRAESHDEGRCHACPIEVNGIGKQECKDRARAWPDADRQRDGQSLGERPFLADIAGGRHVVMAAALIMYVFVMYVFVMYVIMVSVMMRAVIV